MQRGGRAVVGVQVGGHALRARQTLGRAEQLVKNRRHIAAVHVARRALVGRTKGDRPGDLIVVQVQAHRRRQRVGQTDEGAVIEGGVHLRCEGLNLRVVGRQAPGVGQLGEPLVDAALRMSGQHPGDLRQVVGHCVKCLGIGAG